MISSSLMQLYVWPSDYGLISIEPQCLRFIMYMKFAQVPHELNYCRNPLWRNEGTFPIFKDDDYTFTSFPQTIVHLRYKRYSLDFGLSIKSCSEMLALMSLSVRLLEPIYEYVTWIDKRNFEELTRPWFMRVIPLFFNYVYVRRRRDRAFDLLEAYYPKCHQEKCVEARIRSLAKECFALLASRLGNKTYFYGNAPSSLDCTIYAYLAPLIKIKYPSNEIRNILAEWPTLIEYVENIDKIYFKEESIDKLNIEEATEKNDNYASLKLKFFAVAFATIAILGYFASHPVA